MRAIRSRFAPRHVQRDRLPAARQDHVGGVRAGLEPRVDQLARDVDTGRIGGEAVVRRDEDVGRRGQAEAVEGSQHLRDLAVGVPERLARGRRPHAQGVLRVVGLGDPVDHDGRGQLRQHVLAQHPLGPRHRRVVALGPAALRRRGPELGEDRRAHVVRPRHALARIEVAVDEHPDPRRRPGVRQQGAARRARADRGQTKPARLEPLRQRASEDEAPARGAVDLEQAAVGGRIERARRIDLRDEDLVSGDPVRPRLCPGGERGRVHAGDGGEHGMAVREVHALDAQPVQGRGVPGGDGIGPQPIDHEDDDETRAHRAPLARPGGAALS